MPLSEWHEAFREAVEETGLSQAEIARELGVSQPSISCWCRGERTPTSAFADYLLESVQELAR